MDDLLARCSRDNFDWESVTRLAESAHPKEVSPKALLKIIERNPTTDAVKALCKKNPQVLKETHRTYYSDRKSHYTNALGLALFGNASFDLISTLVLEIVSPTKGKRNNKRGRQSTSAMRDCLAGTMIHYDDSIIPLNVLSLLLESFPISLFTEHGRPSDGRANCLAAQIVMNTSKDRDSCWERINVVMTAIFRDATSTSSLVLHRFIGMLSGIGIFSSADEYLVQDSSTRPGIQRAIDILNVIKQRAPEQFRTRDANGALPLHIALSNTHILKRKDNDNGKYPSGLIKYLITEYPESVRIPDKEGRLPLHIAVEHGIPCYGILVEAEDRALTSRCPVTGFYPFQLAEYGLALREKRPRKCSETTAVNISFQLLRTSPHVMNNLVDAATAKEPWIHGSIHKQILANKLKLAQIDYETFLKEKPIQDDIVKLEEELQKERDFQSLMPPSTYFK